MPLSLEGLPQEMIDSIPKEALEHASMAGYNNVGDLIKGHNELAGKTQNPEWTSGLDDSQKATLAAKGWKMPGDVMKGYSEIEKYMGHDKIPAPRKNSDGTYADGELDRVLGALGAPKDANDYKTSENFKLPDGVGLDPQFVAGFKAECKKAGMLPHQFSFVMDKLASTLNDGQQQTTTAKNKASEDASMALRSKWGAAYDQNVALANKVLNTFGDKEQGKAIAAAYGNDPNMLALLANIGENLSEEGLDKVGISGTLITPDAAAMEIKRVMADPKHAYMDASHPEHKYWAGDAKTKGRMQELYKMSGA